MRRRRTTRTPRHATLAGEGLGGDAADSDPAILAARLDDNDPLSGFADRYQVPDGVLYMDGNSLGPASDAALASLDRVVDEWRDLLIAGGPTPTRRGSKWGAARRRARAARRRRAERSRRRQLDHGEYPHARRDVPRRATGGERAGA